MKPYIEIRNFVIFFILAFAFFLRLYRLGFHDFWYDEALSLMTFDYFSYAWSSPLDCVLIYYWSKIFVISEFSLCSPLMVFSLLSLFLIYKFGSRIFNPCIGLFSALFMRLSFFISGMLRKRGLTVFHYFSHCSRDGFSFLLKENTKAISFSFRDANFNAPYKYAEGIYDALIDSKLDIRWQVTMQLERKEAIWTERK